MDGENVTLQSWVAISAPPRHEDKVDLLGNVLSTAKEMNKNGRELRDIALLVSASINAIHAYADGNGRTSRFMYLLIGKDLDSSTKTELGEALSFGGRYTTPDIDPSYINTYGLIEKEVGVSDPQKNPRNIEFFLGVDIGDLQFAPDISEEDSKLFERLSEVDEEYFFLSVFKFLKNPETLNKYVYSYPGGITGLSPHLLSKDLSQKSLKEILQIYRELKKKDVELLIDSVAHPEKPEYQMEHEGKNLSMKEYMEQRIEEKLKKNFEEEREYNEINEARLQEISLRDQEERQKEDAIKERFERGEGEYKLLTMDDIRSLKVIREGTSRVIGEEKGIETEINNYSVEKKKEIVQGYFICVIN